MRSELDPLRAAPLPDSFGRTAAWLRETPPPRRRRPHAAPLVVLLLVVAACSWPVRTPVASGSVIEVLSTDSLRADHPAVRALTQLVPDAHRQLVELEARGADEGGGSVMRYTVLDADAATAARWRDSVEALPGTRATRVLTVGMTERRPLGLRTLTRVLRVSPEVRLSDRELRAELGRAFETVAALRMHPDHASEVPIAVRIADRAAGQRAAPPDRHPARNPLARVRIARLPEGGSTAFVVVDGDSTGPARQVYTLRGDRVDSLSVGEPSDRARRLREGFLLTGQPLDRPAPVSVELAIDSLPTAVARSLRDQLDVRLHQLGALDPIPLDSLRFIPLAGPDSLRSSVRVDTLRRTLRITIVRDTL